MLRWKKTCIAGSRPSTPDAMNETESTRSAGNFVVEAEQLLSETESTRTCAVFPLKNLRESSETNVMEPSFLAPNRTDGSGKTEVARAVSLDASLSSSTSPVHGVDMPPIESAIREQDATSGKSELIADAAPQNWGKRLLATPDDQYHLNPLHCWVRQNIEIFQAIQDDIDAPAPGRKKKIIPYQIGLRCLHCLHVPTLERTKRAICYPSSVSRIYHCVSDMKFDHFAVCPLMPLKVKEEFLTLKVANLKKANPPRSGKSSSRSTARYYQESARKLGIVEKDGGIFLGPPGTDKVDYSKKLIDGSSSIASSSTSICSQCSLISSSPAGSGLDHIKANTLPKSVNLPEVRENVEGSPEASELSEKASGNASLPREGSVSSPCVEPRETSVDEPMGLSKERSSGVNETSCGKKLLAHFDHSRTRNPEDSRQLPKAPRPLEEQMDVFQQGSSRAGSTVSLLPAHLGVVRTTSLPPNLSFLVTPSSGGLSFVIVKTPNVPIVDAASIQKEHVLLRGHEGGEVSATTKDEWPPLSSNPSPSPQDRCLLSMPEDPSVLNALHCFVRQNIEVFSATKEDIAVPAPGRRNRVVAGQVGIRCIHCCSMPFKDRVKRAVCYPPTVQGIYHCVSNMKFDHFEACRAIGADARKHLLELKVTCNRKGGSQSANCTARYYEKSAERMGLVDTRDGIRFRRDLGRPVQVPQALQAHDASPAQGRDLLRRVSSPSDGLTALVIAAASHASQTSGGNKRPLPQHNSDDVLPSSMTRSPPADVLRTDPSKITRHPASDPRSMDNSNLIPSTAHQITSNALSMALRNCSSETYEDGAALLLPPVKRIRCD